MNYFEVSRRHMSEVTSVMINTNTHEPIEGISKMKIKMVTDISDYRIVNIVKQMLIYQDAPIRFTFLPVLEQYDSLCDWMCVHQEKISYIHVHIACDYTTENECVFAYDNMDDFDDFIRALKNSATLWHINKIKIEMGDGSQIDLTY